MIRVDTRPLVLAIASLALTIGAGCATNQDATPNRVRAASVYPHYEDVELSLDDLATSNASPHAFTGRWDGHWFKPAANSVVIVMPEADKDAGLPADDVRKSLVKRTNRSTAAFSEFPVPKTIGPVVFSQTNPAGTLRFEGTMANRAATGTVTFTPNETFFDELAALAATTGSTGAAQTLHVFEANLSLDEAKRFRASGLAASIDDLMALKDAGVTADYACPMLDAGYAFDSNALRSLRFSGVKAEEAVAFKKAGYAFSADDLRSLCFSGVTADYAGQFRAAGYQLSVDDLRSLRFSGIEPAFAAALAKAGYTFGVEDLRRLRFSGVDADYAVALAAPNRTLLSADEIIQLRFRGVDVETIRKLRS